MTKSNKAIILVVALVVVAYAMSTTPQWYELHNGNVYGCTGISEDDNNGICMNVANPGADSYEAGVYEPSFIGGEYYEFNGSGMRSCVVLRKGNVYDMETLCGSSVLDTYKFLADGTLSVQ
jgi:hypothetical protein